MSVDALDTNILVYAFDDKDLRKQMIATRILTPTEADTDVFVSFQVAQECLNVLLSKLGASDSQAREFFERTVRPLMKVLPTPGLFDRALEIRARYRIHFYDALIVAGAIEGGATRLFSEDLQHGQVYDAITVANPFLQSS